MEFEKNILLERKHDLPILLDLFYEKSNLPRPLVIFCHGYKGFKDWGPWNLVAEHFAKKGFVFSKFNFSHNGGTAENPIDFPDLEAFGRNNYIKELDDLEVVINWLLSNNSISPIIDKENVSLIGHSRGGAIVTLKASENIRVKKVVSWAGVSDFEKRFPQGEILEKWKKDGIAYITNARTKQQMPHYYQFYENFLEHKNRWNIRKAVKKLQIPQLIVQGDADLNVVQKEGENLHDWNPNSELLIVKNGDHTFGAKHPYLENDLVKPLDLVISKTIDFLKN